MSKLKELYLKHKELILYVFYGGLTTLVNLVAYWLFDLVLGPKLYLVTNIIAWVLAALFAYFVNKLFVFESKSWAPNVIGKEIIEFFGARVFSFFVEELVMLMFVDGFDFKYISFKLLGFTITGALIAKLILAVVVIILNYFFSKFIIFKKKSPSAQNTPADCEEKKNEESI